MDSYPSAPQVGILRKFKIARLDAIARAEACRRFLQFVTAAHGCIVATSGRQLTLDRAGKRQTSYIRSGTL